MQKRILYENGSGNANNGKLYQTEAQGHIFTNKQKRQLDTIRNRKSMNIQQWAFPGIPQRQCIDIVACVCVQIYVNSYMYIFICITQVYIHTYVVSSYFSFKM